MLKALLAVADTGNVTKASAQLHLVQPAVSRQIKLLEEAFGARLFDRSPHGMVLTAAGEILAGHARRILDELSEARYKISASVQQVSGSVTLGMLPSLCDLLSAPLYARVTAAFPALRLNIVSGYAGHLREGLSRGSIDCALVYADDEEHHRFIPSLEEALWLVGPGNAALPAGGVSWQTLARTPLILPPLPPGIRRLAERAARRQNVALKVVTETDSLSVQKQLVLAGAGMTLLPAIAIEEACACGTFCCAPVGDPPLTRTLGFALPLAGESPAARHVLGLFDACLRERIGDGGWPHARLLTPPAGEALCSLVSG